MRLDRTEKVRQAMEKYGYDALLVTRGTNIEYAITTTDYCNRGNNGEKYVLMFRDPDKDPIVFECIGPDLEITKMYNPWIKEENLRYAIPYKMSGPAYDYLQKRYINQIKDALKERGLGAGSNVAIDFIDHGTWEAFRAEGLELIEGGKLFSEIVVIKTPEEIECMKVAGSVVEAAYWKMRHEWVKPGVRENQVVGKLMDFYISNGLTVKGAIFCSGPNTNPLHRSWTDRIIQQGDMVIVDCGMTQYQGYGFDIIRAWPVEAPFTEKQKEVYREAYYSLQNAIGSLKPGSDTAELVSHFPVGVADEVKSTGLIQFSHSVGMGDYDGYWSSRGFSPEYPAPIMQDMVLSVETYVASPEGPAVRLEDQVVVTDQGAVPICRVPFEKEALED